MSRVGVDVGGTFTDLVALDPDGTVRVTKVPSTPDDPARGLWDAVDAARLDAVEALLHGTTVATNALLERKGARPLVLVATKGFEDLLWLRRQHRAALYDLTADHPPPLVAHDDVIGADERIGPTGIVRPLDDREVERIVARVCERQPQAVVVALLFAFRDPRHERRIARAIEAALPEVPVVSAAEMLPVFREYERTGTATAEGFLRPVVGGYVDRLRREAGRRDVRELRVMASNGGTLGPDQARVRAASLALSGPAGGVEGARLVARQIGDRDLLTLDMGGTSADAGLVTGGEAIMETAGAVGGVPLALPHVLIETVGAGGGSIAWVDAGGALRVGPESAGAVPGPACYGRGGTRATVTDAAVVLGWLDVDRQLASGLVLDGRAAADAVAAVAAEAGLDAQRCAEGIIEVVTATMVRALRRVSVERGLDPRGMTLVPFGGAGPLFACRLAEALGMRRAVIPPHAGALSALGLAAAPARVEAVTSVHRPLVALDVAAFDALYAPLEREVRETLPGARTTRVADCRYPGQGYEVMVNAGGTPAATVEAFHAAHAERFGHADRGAPVELVNARVVAMRAGREVVLTADRRTGGPAEGPADRRTGGPADGGTLETLAAGTTIEGPATVPGADATLRIEAGWRGTVHETGALVIEPSARPPVRPSARPPGLDAIGLEVLSHALAGIAEEMGAVLVASALSPNIRERRDSSAALFTAGGEMMAQAAHIPVHLGAMPEAVAAVRTLDPAPGETFILNDPFTGGTHLPDITMVHAIAVEGAVGGYTVVRAHHSDVGGARAGSMPPDSRTVFEEGLVIPPVRWADAGSVDPDIERLVLANVRTPAMRRGDFAAQLAACERGGARYRALLERFGRAFVEAGITDLLDYAERRTVAALARRVPDGVYHAEDALESDGLDIRPVPLKVRVHARGGRLELDFTGTAGEVPGNVNCPLAVTRSAALFVIRCLVGADVPTNAGVWRALEVIVPERSVLHAGSPRAVAAGNVETSQRVADVIFLALAGATQVPAQGQGTMNNIVFGGDGWTYYETLGGGQGASPAGDGPSAVHAGMSNTLNTPVEVFELEHPLRVVTYALRRGSGGKGRHRGGDGVIRAYEALAPLEASLITERRLRAPKGAAGGGDGAPGRNLLNGDSLGPRASIRLRPGDVLQIETPGGGGWSIAD